MHPRVAFTLALVVICTVAALIGVSIAANKEAGVTTASTGLEITNGWAGAERSPEIPPGAFSLRDQDGRMTSLAAFRGRPVILTFAYSTCQDTCPAVVQAIRGALDEVGTDVPVLAVSVDPTNDTPARARAFMVEQRMTGRMRFLLGTKAQLAPVWREYGIAPQGEDFDHSAYALIIDAQGRQRVAHPAEKLSSDGLAHDLRRLLPRKA